MKVLFYKSNSGRNLILEYIQNLNSADGSECWEVIKLLEKYDFNLSAKYLKRMKGIKRLWELRVSSSKEHRFFFTVIKENVAIILHAFTKKSQKTPMKEIKTTIQRSKLYL